MEDLKECKAVKNFLFYYEGHTRQSHLSTIKKFFECTGKDPNTYLENKDNRLEEYKDDIRSYINSIRDSPPKTFYSYASVIKMFFQRNEVNISQFFWNFKAIKKSSRALTQDRPPDTDEMKKILACSDIKSTTIYLVLLSSGMRVGELVQIKINDIEFRENKPTKIRLRPEYTKTGNPRTCYISNEATLLLKEWIDKHLERYKEFKDSYGRFKSVNQSNGNRVFPMHINSIRLNLINALKKVGLDQKDEVTDRYIIHVHTFRKFFKSRLSQKCPIGIVERLMGHTGYLSEAYDRYTEEDLENAYQGAMQMVSVYESGITRQDIEQLEVEIKRRDKKIDEIDKKVDLLDTVKDLTDILKKYKKKDLEDRFNKVLRGKH